MVDAAYSGWPGFCRWSASFDISGFALSYHRHSPGRQVTLNNDTQNGDAFADPSLHSPQTTAEDTLTPNPEGLLEDTPPEPLLLRETSESQPSVLFAPRWKTNNPFSPAFEKQELKPLPRAESANGPASCSRQAGPAYDGLGSDKMAVDQR